MKVNYPGLLHERLPSGNWRYRVRVEGNPRRRIRLHVDPDHKDFPEHYHAARAGIELKPEASPAERSIRGSISWLTLTYLEDFEKQVEAGLLSPKTLKKRRNLFKQLRAECGEYAMDMPTSEIIRLRDRMAETPAAADSMVIAIRAMYRWAVERRICDSNPATGIGKIDRGKGGAKPWTVADLKTYRQAHPPGTAAHLCLTLMMFTACRIGDAAVLGYDNEFERQGVRALAWQPGKKGSAFVEIPMLPPLYEATRASVVRGKTYLLTSRGKPFASGDALGQRFRKWCNAAGLPHLSSHGIRKAAGQLLALEGCSQYQIMAIHGHSQAKTSEIYTKDVERWRLAREAMSTLQGMEW